eukprot:TRINITY_DN4675_c0_g1_i2.p1 TRINITY_DN4675_c0_g1~~TRINITY_DN4675_c0_g1_i2.p1  ORF type:complete len:214 (+),score=75.17 TRINITY_DN4675_c0_g1_i2:117-758(+)
MDQKGIAQLLEKSRYNVEALPELEAYLQKQLDEQSYFLEANLAILKLYQFNPDKVKPQVIAKILLKSLMHLPNSDYMFALCLISEKLHSSETIAPVIALAQHLEACRFKEFWSDALKQKELLNSVSGFRTAVRNFIISVLNMSYQRIKEEYLIEQLNLDPSEVDDLINKNGWKRGADDKQSIVFPLTDENQAKSKKISETIHFDQLSKLLIHK